MTDQTTTPDPELCLDRGPRVGEDGTACYRPKGHEGSHRAHESWGTNPPEWSQLPKVDPSPDLEWEARFRAAMHAEVQYAARPTELSDAEEVRLVADRAANLAVTHIHPLQEERLRLGRLAGERLQVLRLRDRRIAELEEGVRALGGDPDHMVDPRDHEAAIAAMREAMINDVRFDSQGTLLRAISVAEKHMLRMAQASLGGAPVAREVPASDCICDMDPETGSGPHPYCPVDGETEPRGSKVREVPAGEAREGDGVTLVGKVRSVGSGGDLRVSVGLDGEVVSVPLSARGLTVSRPVSPLPDPVNALRSLVEALRDPFVSAVTASGGVGRAWRDALRALEHEDVPPPAAGVSEGGKA